MKTERKKEKKEKEGKKDRKERKQMKGKKQMKEKTRKKEKKRKERKKRKKEGFRTEFRKEEYQNMLSAPTQLHIMYTQLPLSEHQTKAEKKQIHDRLTLKRRIYTLEGLGNERCSLHAGCCRTYTGKGVPTFSYKGLIYRKCQHRQWGEGGGAS